MIRPNKLMAGLLMLLAIVAVRPAFAQEVRPEQAVELVQFLAASLTLLLPIGLILLIGSAMPEDKAPATAAHLLVVWAGAVLAYFGVGFAFHFGGIAQVSPNPELAGLYWEWYPLDQSVEVEIARLWGVLALRGWALGGEAATPAALRLFLSHVALVGSAALIPAGALIQRGRTGTALLLALLMGTLIYPVAGNWVWGGGWLSHLGSNLGLGHGLVDFGGASLIFLAGSIVALIGLILFRPGETLQSPAPSGDELVVIASKAERLTVYDTAPTSVEEGSGRAFRQTVTIPPARPGQIEPAVVSSPLPEFTPMPSAYLPFLSLLGGGLMLLGWFGLSSGGHTPTAVNFGPGQAAVGGLLAALAGAVTAAGYSWFTTREFNPWMTSRGLAAGLITAAAGAPFIPIWILVIAGLLLGLCLAPLIYLFSQRLRLADEPGIVTTYGLSAILSLLLVAFFADGRAGLGWNGVGLTEYRGVAGQGVSGLMAAPGFLPDWPNQLHAQLLGSAVILLWALLLSFLVFKTVLIVLNAWAQTGLELAPRTQNSLSPAQRGIAETPEETEKEATGLSTLN